MTENTNEGKIIFLRNFIFGVEDSLVSTVGLLSGIAVASTPPATIIFTGSVYIVVEAFSMAVGSFLSEESAQEYRAKEYASLWTSVRGGVVMFISFVAAGLIPIAPYFLVGANSALFFSIAASLVALFILGFIGGKISGVRPARRAWRMFVFGGIAIIVGVLVGKLFKV